MSCEFVEKRLSAIDAMEIDSEKFSPLFLKNIIFCAKLSPPNNSQACSIELM
jgi:hypothetical protein